MRTKELSHLEWVKLACATAKDRPILTAYQVDNGRLTATDGHRLHLAPSVGLPEGLWDAKSGAAVEGPYPNVAHVIPSAAPTHTLDVDSALSIVAGAVAADKVMSGWYVTLTAPDGLAYFSPRYVLDVLKGFPLPAQLAFVSDSKLSPIKFVGDNGREAILMPVRMPGGESSGRQSRFNLDEFTAEVEHLEWVKL